MRSDDMTQTLESLDSAARMAIIGARRHALRTIHTGNRLAQRFRRAVYSLSLRTRLYAIIAFLGVLPLVGVLHTGLAVQSAHRDRLALDRAARGAIHLEHINALVYASVMESRGIYMSPDWKTAEPFAHKLGEHLTEMQSTARSWRAVATTELRGSIEEVARHIDEFVVFRHELRRLARVESPAAARIAGDNETQRAVRGALNDSLHRLAASYEAEVVQAQAKMRANDRNVLLALALLAGLATLALAGGVLVVSRGLLRPLFKLKASMRSLAEGDLHGQVEGIARLDEIGEMARTVAVFQSASFERMALNREAQTLSQLNEWLQSCKSLEELYDMVAKFLSHMLPGCAGSLYIYANSRDILESAIVWNGGAAPTSNSDPHPIGPDDCWGLRRGRTYTYGETAIDFHCAHAAGHEPQHYSCIPILAHGETIGLLHLEFASAKTASEQRRLALVAAEQISMAIANVKLRDQLRDQSIRDTLTGLYNRRYLLETCRREFARASRAEEQVSVLSIDVDHFKRFNDNHGHDAGDTVLRAFAESLKGCFREEDVPCRFGGEEFVVLLPGCSGEVAARRAESLRAKVEGLTVRYLDGALPKVTISVGVATYPDAGEDPQTVLKAADDVLYKAKTNGRNRVERHERRVLAPASPTVVTAVSPAVAMVSPPAANPVHLMQQALTGT